VHVRGDVAISLLRYAYSAGYAAFAAEADFIDWPKITTSYISTLIALSGSSSPASCPKQTLYLQRVHDRH